ncbi:putative efflux protein [Treponema sp. JC4]|uniref:MATE family efflux transporter n=1 Tax=Treponema sp. JC4 TaxID=1124982 RepID=UPI00025B0DF9|nr:MATE family efflux transporter [Treponema sp. JC4]EID85197.1 putative efflux protein [Treponema sp. JC4]
MNNKYFGTWKFYKRALAIAIPIMLQLFIQNLVSLIDNFMVAGLGDVKMSGVNVCGQINFVFIVLINTLCMSGGIFMSQFKGAKDKRGMEQSFRFKLLVTGFFGLVYALLCWWAPRGLYGLLLHNNTDAAAIIDQTVSYAKSVALSWIFMCISQSIASSLREVEIVRPPLVISIIATLVNTVFNYILIYGHFGAPRLEVAGAGYATVIARGVELILFLIYAAYRKPEFLFKLITILNIDFLLGVKILKKSVLILVSELLWAFSETVATALYNTLGGAEVVSGMAGGFAICNLFFICFSGIVTATTVIVGQELGAGHLEEARIQKNWILTGSTLFGCLFLVIGFATTLLVPYVFANLTPEARRIACGVIIVGASYLPLWAFLNAQYAISRAGGDVKMGAICDLAANIAYIASMFFFVLCTSLGPIAIYALTKISDFIKSGIAHWWLKKEKWLVNLAAESKSGS